MSVTKIAGQQHRKSFSPRPIETDKTNKTFSKDDKKLAPIETNS